MSVLKNIFRRNKIQFNFVNLSCLTPAIVFVFGTSVNCYLVRERALETCFDSVLCLVLSKFFLSSRVREMPPKRFPKREVFVIAIESCHFLD